MTSLIIGIVLIVGGIAFAVAPLFRRPRGDATATPGSTDVASPRVAPPVAVVDSSAHSVDATLAADIEELELDRAMGKLGDADYRALRAGLDRRARALQEVPAAPVPSVAHEVAEVEVPNEGDAIVELSVVGATGAGATALDDEVERRIRAARALVVACARCGPRPEPAAHFCSNCGSVAGGCPGCGHPELPHRARFCDRCGMALTG